MTHAPAAVGKNIKNAVVDVAADAECNGNGSLMRILPATLFFAHEPDYMMIQRIVKFPR